MMRCTVCNRKLSKVGPSGLCWDQYTASRRPSAPPPKESRYERLQRRDAVIRTAYASGVSVGELAIEHGVKIERIRRILDEMVATPLPPRTVASLVDAAAQISLTPKQDIVGKSRFRAHVLLRHAVMYLAMRDGHTSSSVGRRLGGRDHSTIIHGARTAPERMARDAGYAAFVERLDATALKRGVA